MAHHFQLMSRIYVNDKNHLILESDATWKDKRLDISRLDYDSGNFSYRFRNLHFVNTGGGWLIEYPGEENTCPYYGGRYTVEKEPYEECDKEFSGLLDYSLMNSFEASEIIKKKPELKYLLNKLDYLNHPLTKLTTFKLMIMWKKHPLEVECLSAKGLYSLALNKNLYKLTPLKKKALIKRLNEVTTDDVTLQDIQSWLKNKISFDEFLEMKSINREFKNNKLTWKEICYCKKKEYSYSNYRDMLFLVKEAGHNVNDDYWRFPSDPHNIHQRLLAEKNEMDKILKLKELEQKGELTIFSKLEKIKKKLKLKDIDIGNGYKLFMPTTAEQYIIAANNLHQCIVSNGYYKKVAKGETLLFMIWKDNVPSSTVEIGYDKTIKQFYGNELDRSNCKPTEYEENAFKKFLDTFIPKKVRVPR